MDKTIDSAVLDALDDLSKPKFERFCHKLLDRREEPRIKRSHVEGKNRLQITDLLVSTFTETGVWMVVIEILKVIGCFQTAKEFGARHPQQQLKLHPDVSMDIEAYNTQEPLPTPLPDQSEYFILTHKPRGWCMVFNNEIFTGGLNNRRGTQKDADALKEVFTDFGFKVKIHDNCTAEQMKREINDLGTINFSDHDGMTFQPGDG